MPEFIPGGGIFIGKRAILNSGCVIGKNSIINTGALVEHGCNISNHVNLSPLAVLNGDVFVGEGSFIGSSSVTIGQIKIGNWAVIGAGAVVINNVDSYTTVAGVPAKVINICPRKFRDKERERNFGVATLKGEHLYGDDESAAKCDTGLDNKGVSTDNV